MKKPGCEELDHKLYKNVIAGSRAEKTQTLWLFFAEE